MPLVTHTVRTNEVKNIIEIGEKNSIIDFGQHAGNMTEEDIEYLDESIKLGVGGFKAFTCPPYHINPIVMIKMMSAIAKFNGIQLVHCEDYEIVHGDTLVLGPITGYELYGIHSMEFVIEGVDSIVVAFKVMFFDVDLNDLLEEVYPFNVLAFFPGITVVSLDMLGIPLSRVMYLHCEIYGGEEGSLSVYYMVSSESR